MPGGQGVSQSTTAMTVASDIDLVFCIPTKKVVYGKVQLSSFVFFAVKIAFLNRVACLSRRLPNLSVCLLPLIITFSGS